MTVSRSEKRAAGFSLLELLVVVAIILILTAISLPDITQMLRVYRLTGDARGLAHQLSLARLRAGTDFTWAQIVINSSVTPNSYSLQYCSTKATSSCTTFTSEGGTQYLSSGVSLGFGSSTLPAGGQTTAAQTTTIIFNSRGIPVTSGGAANANDTIYLADSKGNSFAVSVTLSGHPKIWHWGGASWVSL